MTTDTPDTSVLADVMTTPQVAALLQIPASTVEDYARRGIIPSLKLGRHRRFLRSELEEAIAAMLYMRRPRRS